MLYSLWMAKGNREKGFLISSEILSSGKIVQGLKVKRSAFTSLDFLRGMFGYGSEKTRKHNFRRQGGARGGAHQVDSLNSLNSLNKLNFTKFTKYIKCH